MKVDARALYHEDMSSATLLPVGDYIKTYIDGGATPPVEYVDGRLLPKGMGTRKHSRIQRRVLELLGAYRTFEAFPELHARLRETEFRIPDIIVERKPVVNEEYPVSPVYLCIEILSPDQTLRQLFDKCERYHAWGTGYCWVIDPEAPSAWEYHQKNGRPHSRPFGEALTAGEISLPVVEIFSVLAD
jgi:Uma2 family endonuclease